MVFRRFASANEEQRRVLDEPKQSAGPYRTDAPLTDPKFDVFDRKPLPPAMMVLICSREPCTVHLKYRESGLSKSILQEICKSVWAFWHFWLFMHLLESASYRFYWQEERPIPSLATNLARNT
jgi:hypothetical protein